MAISVSCACGAAYSLKDEFAGQALKCPRCEQVVRAPAAFAIPVPEGDPAFARDRFLLRQKHIAINQKYYVWDEQGGNLLFIERRAHLLRILLAAFAGIAAGVVVAAVFIISALAIFPQNVPLMLIGALLGIVAALVIAVAISPRRHISFYRDDTRREKLLEVLQINKVQLINAHFTLLDQAGQPLARFRKNYLYNLIRRRWYVYNPDGSILAVAKEDSIILSLLRRVLGNLALFLRTNFIVLQGESDEIIGEFNRKFTILDRYVLDMSGDREHLIDRRIAVALGVLLDTGERR